MQYLTERSLFYYFLMREITDAEEGLWERIAALFGVDAADAAQYAPVLQDATLGELTTTDDIAMYKTFIGGFFCEKEPFGRKACEKCAIEAKALALQKAQHLFDTPVKLNRLKALSHLYEGDHAASVLYSLRLLCPGGDVCRATLARDILTEELSEGRNSDAGLILLHLDGTDAAAVAACLRSLPDVLLRPELLAYLAGKYGESAPFVRRGIGF